MTPIQQQLAALAEWHSSTAKQKDILSIREWHQKQAALLDKLAKAETVPGVQYRYASLDSEEA